MARSLTIKHTEAPGTSRLFNVFLLLAVGWLGLSVVASAFAGEGDATLEQTTIFNAE